MSDRILTVPNMLSFVRLAMVPIFLWLVLAEYDVAAIIVLTVSGITDYLDGYLARRFGQVSRLGQLLDPAADRLYILSTLIGLAWRDIVPWWLVVALVARDVVLGFTIPVLAKYGYGPLPVSLLGKAATFCLLYSFPLLLLAEAAPAVASVIRPLAWAFAWWGLILYWYTAWQYIRQVVAVVRNQPSGDER